MATLIGRMASGARMSVPALLVAGALLATTSAHAGLAKSALEEVSLRPAAGARLPLQEQWRNEDGLVLTLGAAIDHRAAVIIFADFTCSTLCGPVVTFAAGALAQSGLWPGADFRLVVLGLDPRDGLAEAARMKRDRIADPRLRAASIFLAGDEATIRRTADAVGYRFALRPGA
jgi:protein SCO1/2